MACQCLSNTKSERHQKCIDKLFANFDVNVKYDSIFSKFENKNRHRIVCFVPTQYEARARDPCRLIFITRCFPITHSWLIVVTSAVNHAGFCKSTATIVVNIYEMLPMSWQSTKWLINFCNLIRIVAALSVREPVIIRMKCKNGSTEISFRDSKLVSGCSIIHVIYHFSPKWNSLQTIHCDRCGKRKTSTFRL